MWQLMRIAAIGLISHWRAHPGQLLSLVIGLSLSTALWSGVQAINSEAKASYEAASRSLAGRNLPVLTARDGQKIAQQTYLNLQLSGWRTSPVLEGRLRVQDRKYRLVGIDVITSPLQIANLVTSENGSKASFDLAEFLSQSGIILAGKETARWLANSKLEGRIRVVDQLGPGILMADIGVAQQLLGANKLLSRLILLRDQPQFRPALEKIAPDLVLITPDKSTNIDRLTESFHLNLTAFGMLSFVVGLFIVHGTIGLSFEQRRGTFRTLRAMGVSIGQLTILLILELVALSLIAGILGVLIGYGIAVVLLPNVAATLRGLYGAEVGGVLTFRPQWWVGGIALAVGGTLLAAASNLYRVWHFPILASAQSRAWGMISSRENIFQLVGSFLLIALALMLFLLVDGLNAALGLIGCVLLGSALLLPSIIRFLPFEIAGHLQERSRAMVLGRYPSTIAGTFTRLDGSYAGSGSQYRSWHDGWEFSNDIHRMD